MTVQVVIPDPPPYFVMGRAKPRKYYLTAQLFYSGVNHFVRQKIVEQAKWVVLPHVQPLAKMNSRIRVDFTMRNMSKGTQDPDNLYFWGKITMDLLKGRVVPDDSKKYVSRVSFGYEEGPAALIINIEETV